MKNFLNIMIVVFTGIFFITACMVDSESMIPAYICGVSVLVLGASCFVRRYLYGSN